MGLIDMANTTKAPVTRTGVRRPWKVFVQDIGPTHSFASAVKAHARAVELVADQYSEVLVWDERGDLQRTVYQFGFDPHDEVFRDGRWVHTAPAPPIQAIGLGHRLVWDPPEIMTAAKRWTCDCGHAALRYGHNVYGSATEVECPNRGSHETQSTQ